MSMVLPMTAVKNNRPGQIRRSVVTRLREKDGLSMSELARRSGISPSYLSKIEAGEKNPAPAVALRIARALEIPLEAIYELNPDASFDLYVLELPKEGDRAS